MRLVFMGTPDIARACLQALDEQGHEIAAVYTKPDTPKNRGMKLTMSEVKQYALSRGFTVRQPANFRDAQTVGELRAFRPELIVVVAYGRILPQSVLDIPPRGCINMHASILPQLRGAGPVQWAILNHLDETGVTAMYLSAGMDEGDIISVRKTPIEPTETAEDLLGRLSIIAAQLACDTVRAIADGSASRTPQDPAQASYAPMLSKDLSPIDWNQPARYILDHVRGLIPWPVATANLGGTEFKIFRVEQTDQHTDCAPGTLLTLSRQGLCVACAGGEVVCIRQLQAPGGKRMEAADYFRGHPIRI